MQPWLRDGLLVERPGGELEGQGFELNPAVESGVDVPDEQISVLIGDDLLVARGFQAVLNNEPDIRVVDIALDVNELVEKSLVAQPDVVLTAFHFHTKNENVLRAIKLIREDRPETKVVVLTYETAESAILAAIEAGCSGFLTKRQTPDDLIRGVRAAHAGDIPMDPLLFKHLLKAVEPVDMNDGTDLTHRERSILMLMSEGLSHTDIAVGLHLSVNTVRNHIQHVLEKLGAHSKLEAVVIARRKGLLIG